MIRFIDMFCGIGGIRLGLEKATKEGVLRQPDLHGCGPDPDECNQHQGEAPSGDIAQEPAGGFQCIWANDNDKYACQIYRKHWGEICEGDIRAVDASAVPEHDLLCAGFPCQSFSIAGKRRGFEDTRGTLFFEICRVIRAKRPGYLLLENVRGLLSHDLGQTFEVILSSLSELGYDCQWQVLNSKDFGVPQNRERVFIVGHTRGKPRPKVFPLGEADEIHPEAYGGEGQEVSPPIRAHETGGQGDIEMPLVATCLDANYGKGWLDHGQRMMIQTGYLGQNRMGERVYSPDGLAVAIRGEGGGWGGKPGGLYDVFNKGFRANQDLAGALKGGGVSDTSIGTALLEGHKIRRLTPLECERLQGFPDGWTEGISDTQRYKCLGNAVTVNVIEAIGRQLLSACP